MARLGGGVAVTGAAGFLGGHFVRALFARGERVVPLVRTRDSAASHSGPSAIVLEEALADTALLRGVEVVVHAAAVRHRHGASPETYAASNVELVGRVMGAARAAGARRFVLVSSVGVYGFPVDLPVTERHPYAPRTLYATSKMESELTARRRASELGIELVVVRPTIVYGPGDRNGMLDKMASMIRAGRYAIVGSGANVLHHTHVDDITEGLWLATTKAEAADDDFILAGPETTSLRALSELVAGQVGRRLPPIRVPIPLARGLAMAIDAAAARGLAFSSREPPINTEKLDIMTLPIAFDGSKARRKLGFVPAVRYGDGVRRTLAHATGISPPATPRAEASTS